MIKDYDVQIERWYKPENFATTYDIDEDDEEETTEFIMEKEDDGV